jgi:hypothetical protein
LSADYNQSGYNLTPVEYKSDFIQLGCGRVTLSSEYKPYILESYLPFDRLKSVFDYIELRRKPGLDRM